MTARETFRTIVEVGIMPVVRAPSAEAAIRVVEACLIGGVWMAEITMTAPGAIQALEKVVARFGAKMVLGAGTALHAETARISMLARAEFIVSPNLRPADIAMAKGHSKAIFPGAPTPTEVPAACEAGADA